MMKKIFGSLAIAGMMLLTGLPSPNAPVSSAYATGQLAVGASAPHFTLKDLSGKEVKLKDFAGKKSVLLVFGASWCPYCREEVPEVNKLHTEYKNKKLSIFAVNVMESERKASSWVKKASIIYPMLMDQEGVVAKQYNVAGIPLSVLIDKTGKIRYYSNGLPPADLIKKVAS